MALKLEELPVEAIARIFSFLDFKDLISVSRLNHFFRDVYENFPELQYSFALQVSGMADADPSLDIRYKLEELERRERAWRALDLSRKVTVKVPHRTSHIYDLSGGVYLLGDCKNSLISRDTHSLRFFDLSSCASGPAIREEAWPEMKVETNIVDIGFGLNEFDLVAVVGIKYGQEGEQSSIVLSLRELSTGSPHPLAQNPDIFVDPIDGDQGKLSIMLEIVGPRLLLLLTWHRGIQRVERQVQDKLVLFNWWEGTKVMTESAPQLTWNGFVFLSPDLILLPDCERGLEIVRLPDVTSGYSPKGFERVLTLSLPALQPLCKVGAIQCRAEPNPAGALHPRMHEGKSGYAARMRARKRSPVVPDPEKAIVLLQMYYREFNNEPHDILMGQWGVLRHNVSLVVHRESLLELVAMFSNKAHPSGSDAPNEGESMEGEIVVPTVPWAQWGPHARWQADDTHVSNWITTTAGQRYVGIDEDGHIVVKDFNPQTVRRARAAAAALVTTDTDVSSTTGVAASSARSGYRFRFSSDSESDSDSGSDGNDAISEETSASGDPTWRSVRVIEGYNEIEDIELRQLFSEECKWPLPCVEYISRRRFQHHGLLMDEERIIGLRHDENSGAVMEFDVFTL